ncbi:MAG: hypothetical protein HQL63_05155 [Magnetococcales bacterium]|nr:hypothetical protein [Magnetococcales bacterium]
MSVEPVDTDRIGEQGSGAPAGPRVVVDGSDGMQMVLLQRVLASPIPRTLLGAGVTALVACVIRFAWVEPQAIGLLCQGGSVPWWCGLREVLGMVFYFRILGWLAIVAALLAHLFPGRARIWGRWAVHLGVLGLVFYNALGGAVGVVVGVLALAADEVSTPGRAGSSVLPVR